MVLRPWAQSRDLTSYVPRSMPMACSWKHLTFSISVLARYFVAPVLLDEGEAGENQSIPCTSGSKALSLPNLTKLLLRPSLNLFKSSN